MTVHSPKTEHHEGKASRIIPIFPELRSYLEAAFDAAVPGTEHVVSLASIRRDRYANVRTRMKKIIRSAGLEPWPKLFQNLRATRETELAQQFPIHVVCEWIGNSRPVALRHYLRVTDGDFTLATSRPTPTPGAAKGGAQTPEALQNQVQQGAATSGSDSHQPIKDAVTAGSLPALAGSCEKLQSGLVPRTGFEPVTPGLGNRCSIL